MRNLCLSPLSFSHAQLSVPIWMLKWRVPPKPLMTLLQSTSGPSKSSRTWDMHAEHRLSIPHGAESVSNRTCRSFGRWRVLFIATTVDSARMDCTMVRGLFVLNFRVALRASLLRVCLVGCTGGDQSDSLSWIVCIAFVVTLWRYAVILYAFVHRLDLGTYLKSFAFSSCRYTRCDTSRMVLMYNMLVSVLTNCTAGCSTRCVMVVAIRRGAYRIANVVVPFICVTFVSKYCFVVVGLGMTLS